jgi:ADP-heptose:LPS heptosyltransferase
MARFKLARLGGQANQFTVGLRWLSSLARSSRSVPLKALRGLGDEPYSVFGLHYGPLKEEDEAIYRQWSNFHPTELLLEDLAGLMMNLDCIVTSDTVTAHLAGALGRPTILLKSTFIDWRWGSVGDQSAWYESMSIIRQRQLMDWSEPIAQLIQQLRERMASH